ncbi:ABC transporter ATP-binding protein [Lactobacillus sp. DCY120]|uniref:ABC transporter ATP-binding protein n=1 Tax=Bombilactobacillus apium TaxID=2675299 RepID=A0A850RAU1_9LACO|nr:ABC transporter ATP-binding protein [Bombilactobacillus apium]NVY95938.1 ABC transporter ATP-binding protein [Bombilactobacillus apium]
MEALISLSNVSQKYQINNQKFYSLKDINLQIYPGEFVVILGPSGAGKSTLLDLLGGLAQPAGGELIVSGQNITGYNEKELANYRAQEVGFIFQFYNLLPTLNVLDNINVVQEITDQSKPGMAVLKAVGLGKKAKQYPAQLSGGEQQRVSIARAIAKNTDLLLCDEPTGALDSKTGQKIMALLQELNQAGKTIVMVTHNEAYADLAHKVITLKDGHIDTVETNSQPVQVKEADL